MMFRVNGIVNRTSSTGPQRGCVRDIGDALDSVDVVDFEQESILSATDTIECHRSDFLALTPVERRKVAGEPDSIQFRLSDRESHLRRGALDMKYRYPNASAATGIAYFKSLEVVDTPSVTPSMMSVAVPMGFTSDPSP